MFKREIALYDKAVSKALKGLKDVTYSIQIDVKHWQDHSHDLVAVYVHLWFFRTFTAIVSVGDDIKFVAGQCRRKAQWYLDVLREQKSARRAR